MKPLTPSSGYITLEIIIAIVILLMLTGLSFTPGTAYMRQYRRMQVRIAAQHFATDIRDLQQKALFGDNVSDKIVILSNNQGYYWLNTKTNQRTYTYFNKIGCDGVFFQEQFSTIQFLATGAPSNASDYIYELKHSEDDSFSCRLTLQISSGRLDINEIS